MPYKPKTKFEVKDDLPQDDPRKIIYGKEFGVEFDAISATFDEVQAGFDQVKDKLEAGGYSMEEAPAGGSQYGRQEVNGTMTWTVVNTSSGGGGASSWDELTGKPSEFPPIDHIHNQSEIFGLDLRLEAIEGSITDGGGFVDAPNDGKLYGRQSENWTEVPDGGVSDWADIENKPTEFPPADHDQPWSSITDTPDDYPPSAHAHAWDDVTDKPTKFPPENHTHNYLSDAPNDGAQYARQSVNSKMVWSAVSGESLVVVDDDAPENPATGQLWFDTDNGTLNLFDGDDWINIASGSKTIFTLPIAARSGVVQLPVSDDADNLPVSLRSGSVDLPLNESGDLLAVTTRGGEIELPLAS